MKKFSNLSDDIKNIPEIEIEKIKNGEYEIESIIDVFLDPKDIKLDEANVINFNTQLNGEVKRGQYIYCICLMRKSGTTSFSSPSIQVVVKAKIIDIYHGLSYLNKILK